MLVAIHCTCFAFMQPVAVNKGPEQDHFNVDALVLTSLECGPVVVQSSVTYRGDRQLDVYVRTDFELKSAKEPDAWKRKKSPRLRRVRGFETLDVIDGHWSPPLPTSRCVCGSIIRDVSPVDLFYDPTIPGDAVFSFRWTIRDASSGHMRQTVEGDWPIIASFAKDIKIVTQAATAAAIDGTCRKLKATLDDPKRTIEDIDVVLAHILHNKHKEFIPIGMRLLDDPLLVYSMRKIVLERVVDDSTEADKTKAFREYLLQDNPRAARNVLTAWDWGATQSSMEGFRLARQKMFSALHDAPNVWVRARLFTECGQECEKGWLDHLLQDLRQYKRPLSVAEIEPYLKRLNADSFKVRTEAQRDLFALQEPVLAPLKKALMSANLSFEVSAAITAVIERVEKAQPSVLEKEMLEDICRNTPENRIILEAVANNKSDAWVTREARSYLKDLSDRTRKK
jgi:hypothetical protein